MATRGEVRKRGLGGRLFLWVFYAFNLLMLWWLISYWGRVGPSLHTGSHAEQAGAAIGTTLGTGFIIFFWALGSIITGLSAFFTRAQRTNPEIDRDDFQTFAAEQPTFRNTFGTAAAEKGKEERHRQFGRGGSPVVSSSSTGWSWSGVLFWAVLAISGLIFLGAVGQIIDPEGARARQEAREVKQQQPAAQPLKAPMNEVTSRNEAAPPFSNFLAVDNLRLDSLPDDTLAVVTVRVPTKIKRVKCAVIERNRYLGVGYGIYVSPPATDVWVTIPGKGYGSGRSLRAECSSER